MREVTTTVKVYQFEELSESAKDKARDWYREGQAQDNWFAESVIEDAAEIADLMGLDIRTRPVKLMGGGTRMEPCVYWSGFSSQGDGACFEGRYKYRKGASKAVKSHAPSDAKLHAIVDGLTAVQKRYGYKAGIAISTSDAHYSHAWTMRFEDIGEREMNEADMEAVGELLRDFANCIYRWLEEEYDYQNADEQVNEGIEANEYEFTEEGERA